MLLSKAGQFLAGASVDSGNKQYVTNLQFTPSLVLVQWGLTTDPAVRNVKGRGFGFGWGAGGGANASLACASQDAAGTTSCKTTQSTTYGLVLEPVPGSAMVRRTCVVTLQAGQITFDWSSAGAPVYANGEQVTVQWLALGGDELEATPATGTLTVPTATGAQTVTLGTTKYQCVLFLCSGGAGTGTTHLNFGLGVAALKKDGSTIVTKAVLLAEKSGVTPSVTSRAQEAHAIIGAVPGTPGSLQCSADCTAFTSTGITLNWTTVPGAGFAVPYVALGSVGLLFNLLTQTEPGAVGDQAVTGAGFQAGAAMLGSVGAAANAALDATASKLSLGLVGLGRDQSCVWSDGENAQATSQEASECWQGATLVMGTYSAPDDALATCRLLDSDGFTLNWPVQTANTREYWTLLVGSRYSPGPAFTHPALLTTSTAIQQAPDSDSLLYTFLSGAQSNVDPGPSNLGFNGATNSAITTLYISIHSASLPLDVHTYLTIPTPYYIKLINREDPASWWLGKVTATAQSGNYYALTVTPIEQSDGTVGAFGPKSPPLSTDQLATALKIDVTPVAAATGRLLKRSVFTSGSAQTLNFQSATQTARIIVVGGGGGGGGSSGAVSNNAIGAGGGGGGTADVLVPVGANTSLTYTVGGGGAGGVAGNNNGTAGSDSTATLGATTYTGHGGGAGQGMAFGQTGVGVTGGAGGTAVNGDFNMTGEDGAGSVRIGATPFQCLGGDGGNSTLGEGGRSNQGVGPATGVNGYNYGSGGSGGLSVGTGNKAGGNGAGGIVIVEEYS